MTAAYGNDANLFGIRNRKTGQNKTNENNGDLFIW